MSAPGLLAGLVAIAAAAAAALGFTGKTADTAKTPAEVRLDRLATVARQLYRQEAHSAAARAAAARIAQDPAVIAAVRSGNAAAVRQAARRELRGPGPVVRVAIADGRVSADVGRTFTVAGSRRAVKAGGRRAVVEAAIQDIAGYVRLVHRRTGLEAVVTDHHGHTYSSLPLGEVNLPRAGITNVTGRPLLVRSLWVRGWNGRSLQVRLLGPA